MRLYSAAIIIIGVLATLDGCALSSADVIEDVIQKLDEYVSGARSESGVTKEDLIAIVDEWNAKPEDKKAEALVIPQYKWLYHFGILPTVRIRDQPDHVVAAHIERFEQAYKRFLPAYQGKVIDNYTTGDLKMQKLLDIFDKLTKNEPCTLKDFEMVRMEHAAWLARYEDIVNYEDVYSNLDEMRNILNYCNGNMIKILFDHVLPRLGEIKDPAALQQLYYDKVWEIAKIRMYGAKTDN